MTDQTTLGYEPEPTDVQALLGNLLGDVLAEPDWLVRYGMLTEAQVLYDALVSRIKQERGKALAEGKVSGLSMEKIAEAAQLGSYQRVQQLIARCCRPGCGKVPTLVVGGLPCCSVGHVPVELRGLVGQAAGPRLSAPESHVTSGCRWSGGSGTAV